MSFILLHSKCVWESCIRIILVASCSHNRTVLTLDGSVFFAAYTYYIYFKDFVYHLLLLVAAFCGEKKSWGSPGKVTTKAKQFESSHCVTLEPLNQLISFIWSFIWRVHLIYPARDPPQTVLCQWWGSEGEISGQRFRIEVLAIIWKQRRQRSAICVKFCIINGEFTAFANQTRKWIKVHDSQSNLIDLSTLCAIL